MRVYTYGRSQPFYCLSFRQARRRLRGEPAFRHIMNTRFYLFCATTWAAAAILILGNGSMAMDALSGVVVLAGFDLLRP